MATVEVSYSGDTDVSQVLIDDQRIMVGEGSASIQVPDDGGDHALTWFVRGAPGSTYEVQLTAPETAKFDHGATIDSSTKDAGLHWFKVE